MILRETVKKVYVSEIEGPRRRGRPVVRWQDKLKEYMHERGGNSWRLEQARLSPHPRPHLSITTNHLALSNLFGPRFSIALELTFNSPSLELANDPCILSYFFTSDNSQRLIIISMILRTCWSYCYNNNSSRFSRSY